MKFFSSDDLEWIKGLESRLDWVAADTGNHYGWEVTCHEVDREIEDNGYKVDELNALGFNL